MIQKMLLGTYKLQDPNERELAALVHGNRLIEATVRTGEELKQQWASPKGKDALRKRNKRVEVFPSYPENTDILEKHLQNDDEYDEIIVEPLASQTTTPSRVEVSRAKHLGEGDSLPN